MKKHLGIFYAFIGSLYFCFTRTSADIVHDYSMETFCRLVCEGLDASWGPQLALQKLLSVGVDDGNVGSSSDKGK